MYRIMINPGHGGSDPGACGNGLREADVALNIGKLVDKYLKAVGYDTKLFQFDGLQKICDTANNWHADLFVSIHCNAGGGTGTETYYFQGSAYGEALAAFIQNQIVQSLPVVNRGLKTKIYGSDGRPYDPYVLKYTDMPATLIELGFIDNANDAKLLRDRQDDFARAIARGVSDFFAFPKPDVIDSPTRR